VLTASWSSGGGEAPEEMAALRSCSRSSSLIGADPPPGEPYPPPEASERGAVGVAAERTELPAEDESRLTNSERVTCGCGMCSAVRMVRCSEEVQSRDLIGRPHCDWQMCCGTHAPRRCAYTLPASERGGLPPILPRTLYSD
jgi:hypothetical protein